jgi:hypothetical protein
MFKVFICLTCVEVFDTPDDWWNFSAGLKIADISLSPRQDNSVPGFVQFPVLCTNIALPTVCRSGRSVCHWNKENCIWWSLVVRINISIVTLSLQLNDKNWHVHTYTFTCTYTCVVAYLIVFRIILLLKFESLSIFYCDPFPHYSAEYHCSLWSVSMQQVMYKGRQH